MAPKGVSVARAARQFVCCIMRRDFEPVRALRTARGWNTSNARGQIRRPRTAAFSASSDAAASDGLPRPAPCLHARAAGVSGAERK
jgi:hypothetical protein